MLLRDVVVRIPASRFQIMGRLGEMLLLQKSKSARECFFHFAHFPFSCALKRFYRARVIVMQNGVELVGQTRVKIMADLIQCPADR